MTQMNIAVTDDDPKDREKIIHILSEYAASNQMEISVSEYASAEGLAETSVSAMKEMNL